MKINNPDIDRPYHSDALSAFPKALERTRALLLKETPSDYNYIHSVKSILYAAIEQVGMQTDQWVSLQRMLRELFVIVGTKPDLRVYEKEVAMQILEELNKRFERAGRSD